MNKFIEFVDEFFKDENKVNEMYLALQRESDRVERYIENIHNRSVEQRNQLFNNIVDKYKSKIYRKRELKGGYYNPRESLFSIILEYAREYGVNTYKQHENEINCDFMTESYKIDNWEISLYQGQGSYITFVKIM